jgi:methyl-accepting chemotaxis protein
MFCDPDYVRGADYSAVLDETCCAGEFFSDEYKRIGKRRASEIQIQASYNPIFDADGKPFKIVKFATDVTERISNVESAVDRPAEHGRR